MVNRVVHFEIPYDDGARAQSFYSTVFGWDTFTPPGMEGYSIVTAGPTDPAKGPTEPGFINGGMLARDETFKSPNLVLDVDNIEKSLEQVEAAGGSTVSARQPVGDMGFCAYFHDTEGNLVGLWESAPQ